MLADNHLSLCKGNFHMNSTHPPCHLQVLKQTMALKYEDTTERSKHKLRAEKQKRKRTRAPIFQGEQHR